jgi:hypothetical protein
MINRTFETEAKYSSQGDNNAIAGARSVRRMTGNLMERSLIV